MNLLIILLIIFNSIPPVSTPNGRADVWPGFRGAGDSHSAARELPLEWADAKNVAWNVALPGYGQSSPMASLRSIARCCCAQVENSSSSVNDNGIWIDL